MLDGLRKVLGDPGTGTEQEPEPEELTPETQLAASRQGVPYLAKITGASLAKYARSRWDRLEKDARKVLTQLKVNHARFEGESFAQVHPKDPNRVYLPDRARQRTPPTHNKIRRTVHRYMSQVTADEPIIEGVPARHTDEARDAAEAATEVLRGEWHRMNLHRRLQRLVQFAGVFRSGFWMFSYDKTAGGRTRAQKYFKNPDTGDMELDYVDANGNRVDSADAAKEIWQGDIVPEELTPMNVRWAGAVDLRDATEVMVAKLMTLRELYDMDPSTREVKLSQLLSGVPKGATEWLQDIRGANGLRSKGSGVDLDELGGLTGSDLDEADSRLDANVFVLHYFRKPNREYKKGYHVVAAGKHAVYRGPLRYGVIPVVQVRLLDDIQDPLGLSLVDLLKDPQELLDFVNGQILRFLQSMKKRWFVPLNSSVSANDLLNPTRSYIQFNPNAGPPVPEQVQELPRSLPDIAERFSQEYNDEAGINDIMRGKHVPGVQSGRHAEALRSGDETLLGLTRTQIQEALEDAGVIILEMVKKEWKAERRVAYFKDREYIEKAFRGADIKDTAQVRLKKGTLLMLTPAQKLETLFGYAEMGALTAPELRKLAPLADTAGISVTEDPHYQKARRENDKFLAGPPDDLVRARKRYETKVEALAEQMRDVQAAVDLGYDNTETGQADVPAAIEKIQADTQRVEAEWQNELVKYIPPVEVWESQQPEISQLHAQEHSRAFSQDRVRRMPKWWVEEWHNHFAQHMQAVQAAAQAAQPQAQ